MGLSYAYRIIRHTASYDFLLIFSPFRENPSFQDKGFNIGGFNVHRTTRFCRNFELLMKNL